MNNKITKKYLSNNRSKILELLNKKQAENLDENEILKIKKSLEKIKWPKYKIIDSHIHILDFTQKTEWLDTLLYYMDKSNIKKAVIFWMSVIKTWAENEREWPDYYLDDDNPCYYYTSTDHILASEYKKLKQKDRERFFPICCWFNPMDINAIDHIKRIFLDNPWVFYGIWEIFYRHDDLTFLTHWEPPRMNTIASEKILEFATKYDLPVMIHNNIASPWITDYPKYLHEMEVMLRKFPKAKVILAHCWASRRINAPYYVKMIDRLLTKYEWLYVDYSWVVFEEIIAHSSNSMIEWVELTEKFNSRVMIWSDILWKWFHKVWYINNKYNTFLDMLSEKTRNNVCINNALEVYSKSKNNVELDKKRVYPSINDIKLD